MRKRGNSFWIVVAVLTVSCLSIWIYFKVQPKPEQNIVSYSAAEAVSEEAVPETETGDKIEETVPETETADKTEETTTAAMKKKDPITPDDDAEYNETNGHWYKVFDYEDCELEKDFDEWERFCEAKGGYLAVINDEDENEFIYDYIKQNDLPTVFFGLADQYVEGEWQWVKEESDYFNWADGQPNNGANNTDTRAEDYAQFFKDTADGKWNDAMLGSNSSWFICEWGE